MTETEAVQAWKDSFVASINSNTGNKYDRIIYHCEACDAWVNVV